MNKHTKLHMESAFTDFVNPMGPGKMLEVGSKSARLGHRPLFEKNGWTATGIDLKQGPNVDVVLEDPFSFPFENGYFDVIISDAMLEHNSMFWISFMEMARVLRIGGLMIHITPSRGPEHRAPQDCWRFYRDGMKAAGEWCGMEMLRTSTDWLSSDLDFRAIKLPKTVRRMRREAVFLDTTWGHTVGVFKKATETHDCLGAGYIKRLAKLYEEMPIEAKATRSA